MSFGREGLICKSDGLAMTQHSWRAGLNFIRAYWTRIIQVFWGRYKFTTKISCRVWTMFFLPLCTDRRAKPFLFLTFSGVIYISWQITTTLVHICGLGNDLILHANKAYAMAGHLICFRWVWVRNLLTSCGCIASDDNCRNGKRAVRS